MPGDRSVASGGDLDTLFRLGVVGDWPDDRLLGHFVAHRDAGGEAAFEAIVRRHGPMVWRVCRGVLGDAHAAEDAFQATFLVLAERAGAIRRRDSVASWLYGVARRISCRARLDASRRRSFERHAARPEAVAPGLAAPGDHEAMLREVDRLPAHYRAPVLLHDLGGCSYEEVARRLGCPIGTVKARLSRGRALLRDRLTARGLSPTASPIPVALSGTLAERTVRSAVSLAMGRAATAAVPPAVAASARWMLDAMLLAQIKTSAALVAVLGLLAAGAAAVIASQGAEAPAPAAPTPPAVATLPTADPIPTSPRQEAAPTIEEVDRRAREIATALDDPAQRAEILLDLGQSQARRGRTDAALDTFRQARMAAEQIPPDALTTISHPIIRIAAAQADAGDRDAARDTFRAAIGLIQAMDDDQQLRQWSNLLVNWVDSIGRSGIRTVAEPYLAFAERSPLVNSDEASLRLDALAGDFATALQKVRTSEFFQDPDHASERRRALLTIADALRPGDRGIADEVLAEAKQAALPDAGPRPAEPDPDESLRNRRLMAVAQIEARLGRFDDALATNRLVDTSGPAALANNLKSNQSQSFLVIAGAQIEAGDWAGARESVDEALQVVGAIEQPGMIPIPKNMAADLYLKLGAIEEAEALAAELTERWGGAGAHWLGVAKAKRAEGDEAGARVDLRKGLDRAEGLLRHLLARPPEPAARPAPDPVLRTTDTIAQAAANVARLRLELDGVEAALRTIDDLPDESHREAILALAELFAGEGELDAAWSLINGIDSPELRDRAILLVAIAMPATPGAKAGP